MENIKEMKETRSEREYLSPNARTQNGFNQINLNFLGKKFLNNKLEEVTAESSILKVKVVGLYFTSSWCPPCEQLTADLLQVYREANFKEKNMEIVQISNESCEKELKENMSDLPWLFVPFEDSFMLSLVNEYKVTHLPLLIIVNKDKVVLTDAGRRDVTQMKAKAYEEWLRLYKEQRDRDKELAKLIDN